MLSIRRAIKNAEYLAAYLCSADLTNADNDIGLCRQHEPRHQVTERGVCSLAQNCPGLHTLNMTGCVEVGLGGLHGLIEGVGESLVKEAKTFFGFIPRRSMIDRRVCSETVRQ